LSKYRIVSGWPSTLSANSDFVRFWTRAPFLSRTITGRLTSLALTVMVAAGADGCGAAPGCCPSVRMQVEQNRTQRTATPAGLWRLMQDIDGLFQSAVRVGSRFLRRNANHTAMTEKQGPGEFRAC